MHMWTRSCCGLLETNPPLPASGQEFSKGARTITELDFARILLRYTFLNTDEYENILDR